MFSVKVVVHYLKDFITNEDIDDKLLLLLAYLRIKASMKGEIGATLETIVKSIGYTPDKHKGKSNEAVLNQLKWLVSHDYISINLPTENITPKGYIEIKINNKNNIFQMIDEDGVIRPYVTLTDEEYIKITTTKTTANKGILLRVFLNIKKRINFDDVTPKICYPSQSLIARDCNLKSAGYTVNNAIKELVDMKVLFEHVTGGYKDKYGNVRNANNVYAVDLKELNAANQTMLNYYKNERGIDIESFIPFGLQKADNDIT